MWGKVTVSKNKLLFIIQYCIWYHQGTLDYQPKQCSGKTSKREIPQNYLTLALFGTPPKWFQIWIWWPLMIRYLSAISFHNTTPMFAMTPHGEDGNRCIRYHWRNDQPSSRCKDGDTPAQLPPQMPLFTKIRSAQILKGGSFNIWKILCSFWMFLSIYLKSHGP